jgi:hypothetical protein
MNPLVELGDTYLSAKINGKDFIATNNNISFQLHTVSNAQWIVIEGIVDGEVLTLQPSGHSFPPGMVLENPGPYGSLNSLTIGQNVWTSEDPVEITDIISNKIVKGTFSFTLTNSEDNSTKSVTEGVFQWTYN